MIRSLGITSIYRQRNDSRNLNTLKQRVDIALKKNGEQIREYDLIIPKPCSEDAFIMWHTDTSSFA